MTGGCLVLARKQICVSGPRFWVCTLTPHARYPVARTDFTGPLPKVTMLEADAFSVLAKSVVTVRDRAGDGRAWDDVTVRLAAGVLQRAFKLDEQARDAFLDLARDAERRQATERWRGR
jgi:hypothetical protein